MIDALADRKVVTPSPALSLPRIYNFYESGKRSAEAIPQINDIFSIEYCDCQAVLEQARDS